MSNLDSVFYDSSQMFYCSGKIGYRWAVKTIEIAASNLVKSHTDTLALQEVLDFFNHNGDHEKGVAIFSNVKKVMNVVLPVTVQDFELSYDLHKKFPVAHPRGLIHSAVILNAGFNNICTTFATGYEAIPVVKRVNLMDKVDH